MLKLCDSYCTSVLLSKRNGGKEVIPVLLLEHLLPLAFVYETADWICRDNLIGKEKIFRIIIQDSVKKYAYSMQTFQGADNDDKMKFEDFEKKFIESFNDKNFK